MAARDGIQFSLPAVFMECITISPMSINWNNLNVKNKSYYACNVLIICALWLWCKNNNTFRLYEKEHNLALLILISKRCRRLVYN